MAKRTVRARAPKIPAARRPSLPSIPAFDLGVFLSSAGLARKLVTYAPAAAIYSQGDPATDVFYLTEGSVKLAVLSRTGK